MQKNLASRRVARKLAVALAAITFALLPPPLTADADSDTIVGMRAYDRQEFELARRLLTPPAEQGHMGAQLRLFSMFSEGLGVSRNLETAEKWRDRAFESNGAPAAFAIANIYFQELGPWTSIKLTRDVAKGREWFERAYRANLKYAQRQLAVAYLHGSEYLVEKRSATRAIEILNEAVDNGDEIAACYIGYIHENGWGVPLDAEKALASYQRAIGLGSSAALFRLAHRTLEQDSPAATEQARAFFRKGIAGRNGSDRFDKVAIDIFNWLTARKDGRPIEEEFKGLQTAAEACHPEAQYLLAVEYLDGVLSKPDRKRALKWASTAAAVGHRRAQRILDEYKLEGEPAELESKCLQYPLFVCLAQRLPTSR